MRHVAGAVRSQQQKAMRAAPWPRLVGTMAALSPSDVSTLSLPLAGVVSRICGRFEAAWRAGRRPCLEHYLGDTTASVRPALLQELVALEWAYRCQNGDCPDPEEYRRRFPEHAELIGS